MDSKPNSRAVRVGGEVVDAVSIVVAGASGTGKPRPRTRSSLRHSTIMTATFAALQNFSCTEARQGRSELRWVSNPGEVAAVPSRNTSGKLFAIW